MLFMRGWWDGWARFQNSNLTHPAVMQDYIKKNLCCLISSHYVHSFWRKFSHANLTKQTQIDVQYIFQDKYLWYLWCLLCILDFFMDWLIVTIHVRVLIINLSASHRCRITIITSREGKRLSGWNAFNVKQMYNVLTLH